MSATQSNTIDSPGLDVLFSRQPIYDRRLGLYGYELLCGTAGECGPAPCGAEAARVEAVVGLLLEIGLEGIAGSNMIVLPADEHFLSEKLYRLLSPERVVLRISEPNPSLAFLASVREVCDDGFGIEVDDLADSSPLHDLANTIRIDVGDRDPAHAVERVGALSRPGVKFLAASLETHELLDQCRQGGFQQFQGSFFTRPRVQWHRRSPTDRLSLLSVIEKIHGAYSDLAEVEKAVERSVTLSYKLLRYVNSALFAFARRIESIRHAVVMLGLERVRACVTLLLMSSVDDKPHELTVTALVRGRMCQLLGEAERPDRGAVYFTVGLLSVLDALMDRPLPELLEETSISEEVKDALLEKQGDIGRVLDLVLNCEQGNWDAIITGQHQIPAIREAYIQSISWAFSVSEVLDRMGPLSAS